MKIGVVFEGELHGGGGYQAQLSTIIELQKLENYSIMAIVFSTENKIVLEKFGVETILIKNSFLNNALKIVSRQEWFYFFSSRFKLITAFEKILHLHGVDLVYFLAPSELSLDLVATNYVITVWDLCHRDTPEFPEVNFYREFERREVLYRKSLVKAVAVLVDSQLGKENTIRRYGVDECRVHVAQFSPSVNIHETMKIDVKQKYTIEGEYVYYPAQFWSHKNHTYIIDAIAILKSKGIILTAVFSGSDKGNLEHVLHYAKLRSVDNLIKYIGFAENEELYCLYKQSLALVMPSYFGPTNIPPLEAFAIGTPVIYSDIDGLRDQVGEAALLCDLKTPDSLVGHLISLVNSGSLRHQMIEKGNIRLRELQQSNITNTLNEIFCGFALKLKCWKKDQ